MEVVETQALFHFSLGLERIELSHDFPAGESPPSESPKSDALDSPVYGQGQCDAIEVTATNGNLREVDATKVAWHETAVRVQKVYRSYRTRRKLADSAVLAEELWWQAIDYARLSHSTVSFFNFSKPETAASRWNRISLNASKVGKGLSKDAKAQKLAFQHWIEAIDPRHRYGHFLHLYYEEWCKADSGQPFFYWLDVGNGKDIDLKECSRSKLRQQCIQYLGPHERELYEYIISDCKIIHKQSGKLLHTANARGDKWIFVMSTSRRLYAGVKKKGHFHHSSFLAGGATFSAGKLDVENGILKSIAPYSGHYRPTEDSFDSFIAFLMESGVNFDQVQVKRGGGDSDPYDSGKLEGNEMMAKVLRNLELPKLQIPNENEDSIATSDVLELKQTETVNRFKRTLSGGLQSPKTEVPRAAILQRINSKKSAGSYQLGDQLSRTWSSGAGPRIGCVADYPVELRVQALEFVDLSPRTPPTPSSYWLNGGLTSPTDQVTSNISNDTTSRN